MNNKQKIEKTRKQFTHLSKEERYMIETLYTKGTAIRSIAVLMGRSPNTISYEIKRNTVKGYTNIEKHNKIIFHTMEMQKNLFEGRDEQ